MQGVEVDLPQSPSKPINTKDDEPVIVSVKADKTLYINLGKTPEQAVPMTTIKNQLESDSINDFKDYVHGRLDDMVKDRIQLKRIEIGSNILGTETEEE